MKEEQLLKPGERINQLFSTDIKIIPNREVFSYSWIVFFITLFLDSQRGLIVDFCAGNGAVGLLASSRTQARIIFCRNSGALGGYGRAFGSVEWLEEQMQVICDDLKKYVCPH